MTADTKGTLAWLASLAKTARELGHMVVLTADEADAIVQDAKRPPPLPEDTGDVT